MNSTNWVENNWSDIDPTWGVSFGCGSGASVSGGVKLGVGVTDGVGVSDWITTGIVEVGLGVGVCVAEADGIIPCVAVGVFVVNGGVIVVVRLTVGVMVPVPGDGVGVCPSHSRTALSNAAWIASSG